MLTSFNSQIKLYVRETFGVSLITRGLPTAPLALTRGLYIRSILPTVSLVLLNEESAACVTIRVRWYKLDFKVGTLF